MRTIERSAARPVSARAVLEGERLDQPRWKVKNFRWQRWSLGAAISAGIAFAIVASWGDRREQRSDVASLVEARGVVWAEGQPPIALGTRLGGRDIRCVSGTFKLVFDVGARVSVEGPADLRILSGMRLLAFRGRITAHVDGRAKGFAIETPNTLIVDQGTEFGVEIDAAGQTDVVVFQGLVDLAHSGPADRKPPSSILARAKGCTSVTQAC